MLKPHLIKSLIMQNAALLREKQQLMEHLRAVVMTLHAITKKGKDSGVVDLKELHSLYSDMQKTISSNDILNFKKLGTLRSPTKKDLGKLAEADQNIVHGFFVGSSENMQEFLHKMIEDLMKMKPPQEDGESSNNNYFNFPISPDKFGADLQGEWQWGKFDLPEEDQDPFNPFD
jgi:hypothetical protein